MKHMTYVIGIKVRIFPSTVQKRIIAKNDGVTRFIYNRLVARDRELHSLQKVQIYCEPVASRIDYLKSLGTICLTLKLHIHSLKIRRLIPLPLPMQNRITLRHGRTSGRFQAHPCLYSIRNGMAKATRQTASMHQGSPAWIKAAYAFWMTDISRSRNSGL